MHGQKSFENLYAHNRHQLHEVVPLNTPYSVNIEPSSRCNIKCVYCVHSLTSTELKNQGYSDNYLGANMKPETFQLLLDQLCAFPDKIRSITFGGVGEPLMHPKLAEMVGKIKESNVTDRINLITNGLLLSKRRSAELVEAGLSSIKISLQGIDAQAYYETCGARIDFDSFLDNLDFLYQNKKQCLIGIKVPDISLYRGAAAEEYPQRKERFRELFESKCDRIGIEHIVPCFANVDYSQIKGMSGHVSRYDIPERKVKVCSQPFYRLNIMQNGSVTLCTMLGLHEEWMNIHQASLMEIWNSAARKQKLIKNLRNIYDEELSLCKNCNIKFDFAYEEDMLDPYAEEIIRRLEG